MHHHKEGASYHEGVGMTQDEIIEMAKQADAYADAMDIGGQNYIGLRDKYFADLVAAKYEQKIQDLEDMITELQERQE